MQEQLRFKEGQIYLYIEGKAQEKSNPKKQSNNNFVTFFIIVYDNYLAH